MRTTSRHWTPLRALLPLSLLAAARCYNNGLGRTPPQGWSSWYSAPDGSQVTDAFVRANAQALLDTGLAAKGYTFVNVDEGWLKFRAPNGTLVEDAAKFPLGMRALGDWIRAQPVAPGSPTRLQYGLYSCRGTCQCSTGKYQGPGGQGHEKGDTDWMVAQGATWLKIDSVSGVDTPLLPLAHPHPRTAPPLPPPRSAAPARTTPRPLQTMRAGGMH